MVNAEIVLSLSLNCKSAKSGLFSALLRILMQQFAIDFEFWREIVFFSPPTFFVQKKSFRDFTFRTIKGGSCLFSVFGLCSGHLFNAEKKENGHLCRIIFLLITSSIYKRYFLIL